LPVRDAEKRGWRAFARHDENGLRVPQHDKDWRLSRRCLVRWALVMVLLPIGSACAETRLNLVNPPELSDLVVSGVNHDAEPRTVTIRIDDRPNAEYTDRVNEERSMPPGPFTLHLRIALLRTPRQRALNLATVFRALAFVPDGGSVVLDPLRLESSPHLPPGARGWFFGPSAAVPLEGFESVQPGDSRISGPHVEAIVRPGGDPVLAYGVRLTRFATILPPGRWRVTLWTEDPGAWETLPVVLQQRIRVNGSDILSINRDYAAWVQQRYLAGRSREANPAETPFAALAAHRGGRISGVVTVADDGLLAVELAGFPQAATHLAALTAEPADAPPEAEPAVEAIRAARFAENWPVLRGPPGVTPVSNVVLAVEDPASTSCDSGGSNCAVTAPDGIAILRFRASTQAATIANPTILWDDAPLPARLLWGQWRWRRPGANTAGLVFSAAHLRGDSASIPLRPDLPRPLVLVVRGTTPGIHRGRIRLHTPEGDVESAFAVEVLPVHRPDSAARIGPFLGFATHLLGTPEWSKADAIRDARAQAKCDMDVLAGLGLTAVTTPLTAPEADPAAFVADLRAGLARFPAPALAYEPLRAFALHHQPAETAAMIAGTNAAIRQAGLPPVIWSVADEPAYAGTTADIHLLAAAIHAADPAALLAGHLNDPRDAVLLPDLAMVTVNQGFGADASDIARLRERRLRPWLYNMPYPRLAAGAYLWRSGADGLLQWHARMPTADPFDPTDGREGDVQFLWPTPTVCGAPDLDEDLLTLVEAAEDLRWFAWLDVQAGQTSEAAKLRRRLRMEIPADWHGAAGIPEARIVAWREAIIALARKLKS